MSNQPTTASKAIATAPPRPMPTPAPTEMLVEDLEVDVGELVDEGVLDEAEVVDTVVIVLDDDSIVELTNEEVLVTSQYVGETDAVESSSEAFFTSPVKGLT